MACENATEEFCIFGKKLIVSPGRVEYNRLRSAFRSLAREQADEAAKSILQFKENPGALLCDGLAWAKPYFAKASEFAVEELLRRGRFDLDAEAYLDKCFDFEPWKRGFGLAYDEWKAVVESEKRREADRREFSDDAGSAWMGGGFGVGNAIKGAVVAEVLNLATGTIADSFNKIGRKKSQKKNAQNILDIFERRKEAIVGAVFDAIANGADALVACCNERGIKIDGAVTSDDIVKAERMFNNLKTGKIPANMVGAVKLSILEANPYCQEFYDYVFMSDGDATGELEKVGAFFGISLDDRKKDAFASRLGECPCGTEEAVKVYREKAVALAVELKYDAGEMLMAIDEKLGEFDRLARTVGGRLFDSRELAAKHRMISEMITAADLSTEESVLSIKSDIETKAAKLGIDISWQLDSIESALRRFDEAARTVDGKMFDSREEARKQQVLSDFERELDISTEEAAVSSLAALDAKIKELGIDGEWKRERVRSAVSRFEQMACTAFDCLYPTRDAAKMARGDKMQFLAAVEQAVRQYGSRAMPSGTEISAKKMSGAMSNLGVVPGERIIGLVDTSLSSLFMNMRTGLALTDIGIRWKNGAAATVRNFISWQDYATMPLPIANGKLIDLGKGCVFEAGGLLGAPVSIVLAMLQRVAGYCKEATCF